MRMCICTYNKVPLLGKAIGDILCILLEPAWPGAEKSCWGESHQEQQNLQQHCLRVNSRCLCMLNRTWQSYVVSVSIKAGASWWIEGGYVLISSHPPGFSSAAHPRLLETEKLALLLWELRNRLSPVPGWAGVAYLTSLPTTRDRQHIVSAAADKRTGRRGFIWHRQCWLPRLFKNQPAKFIRWSHLLLSHSPTLPLTVTVRRETMNLQQWVRINCISDSLFQSC